ncbi:MAG: hypothetical protein IJQ84_06045 [Paludibacteraceae bacterium]|nr:hypothetical protein [Paludibacteraceae bacterium]MBR0065414.1 hypothetical protein [Paludibacteraceae bacterium]
MAQITQETLNDMIATVNAGKQYDMQTWHQKFPEFGGDDALVQSAMDYVATYNSGKYNTTEELNAQFPEFFTGGEQSDSFMSFLAGQEPVIPNFWQQTTERVIGKEEDIMSDDAKKRLPKGYMVLNDDERRKAEQKAIQEQLAYDQMSFVERESQLPVLGAMDLMRQRVDSNNRIRRANTKTPEELFTVALASWQKTNEGIHRSAQYERDLQEAIAKFQKDKQKEFSSDIAVNAIIRNAKAGKITKEQAEQQLQSIWEAKYSEELATLLQPIQETFQQDFYNANQRVLDEEVNRLAGEELTRDIAKTQSKFAALDKKWSNEIYEATGAGKGIGLGAIAYSRMPAKTANSSPKVQAAKTLTSRAKELQEAALKNKGFGSAFGSTITDISTWDFGLTDFNVALGINVLVRKIERDEELDDYDKVELDAILEYMAAQAMYSGQLGRWYKAGTTTAQAVPFMLEFLLMPIDSIKNATVKAMFKYGLKKYGIKQGTRKAVDLGISAMGRFAGSMAAAGLMTVTFDTPKVMAGTIERTTGTVNAPDLLNDGLQYTGRTGQQGLAEAAYNATVDKYIENLSEMILSDLAPALKLAGMSKIFRRVGGQKALDIVRKLTMDNKVAGALRTMQTGDIFEEFAEEEVGNLLKWWLSTDVSAAEGNTGFDADSQIDTILGLIPMQAAFGVGKAGAATINFAKGKKMWSDYRSHLTEQGQQLLGSFMEAKTDEEAKEALSALLHQMRTEDNMDAEMKEDFLHSVLGEYQSKYAEYSAEEEKEEGQASAEQEEQAEVPANEEEGQIQDNGTEHPTEEETTVEVETAEPVQEKARPVTVVIDGVEQQITFSGSKIVYNADGSINHDKSGQIYLQDADGHLVPGSQQEEMSEALDAALRQEKQNGDELLKNDMPIEEVAEETPATEEAPVTEESSATEQSAYPLLEDGTPDFAQMTPEQQVAYAMETGGEEAAAETIQTAIEELTSEMESVGKKKGLVPAQRVAEKNRIRQEIAAWQALAQPQESAPAQTDIRPVGISDFGPIYDQFRGKPQEAIAFLMERQDGECIGALSHPEIGPIDLVWGVEGTGGSDGFGLSKLVKFHPEVLDNLQGILDEMHVTLRSENRIQLESERYRAGVRLTWNNESKTWLLTAFEKEEYKENSALDKTTDTDETANGGEGSDTALPQNTISGDKGTTKNPDTQISGEENAEKVDLSAENVVLMYYNKGSRYVFCRKEEDGTMIRLDTGKPLETTRNGKETAWREADRKVVLIDGVPYYMLGSNPNSTTVNVVPVEASMPVITSTGENSSVIAVEKGALTDEKGKRIFRNAEDNREEQYKTLRREAKTLDDIADYVVFDYMKDGEKKAITLRDLLRMFSTVDEDMNRIYIGDKRYGGEMDRLLSEMGKDMEERSDVEEILNERISEAAIVWNTMAEDGEKVKDKQTLPKKIRAFIEVLDKRGWAEKADYFAGRVASEQQPSEEQEQKPKVSKRIATDEDMQTLADLNYDLRDAERAGDYAEADRIKQEIASLREQIIEYNIGNTAIDEAAGRRTIGYLRNAGVDIEEISQDAAEQMMDDETVEQLRSSDSTVYGFTQGDKIYVISGKLNPNTPVHEYTHLWARAFAKANPKKWSSIVNTLKQTPTWAEVEADANYASIHGNEQAIASEVLARLTGEYWGQIDENGKSKMDETFEKKALLVRVRSALRSFWQQVGEWLGIKTSARISDFEGQLQALVRRPIRDLIETDFDKKFQKMQEGLDNGGENVLSLQSISELTDALEDDIRQGNKPVVFERVPLAAMQEGLRNERTLTEALAIVALRSRRQHRAYIRDGQEVTAEEKNSRDGSNNEMLLDLIQYAKEKGMWVEDVVETLDEKYGFDNRVENMPDGEATGESHVWIDKENGVVIKAKADYQYETIEELLEGMMLNNWLFKGNRQHIIGFGIDRSEGRDAIRVIYETPYVEKHESKPLTQEEKDRYMAAYGFTKADSPITTERKGEKSNYTNGEFMVADLHNQNIFWDADGDVRCIDPIVKWEAGEHYQVQTPEQKERDEWNESRLDEMFDGQSEYQIFTEEKQPAHAEPMSWLQRKVNAAADQANGIRVMQQEIERITGRKITYDKDVREALEHSSSIIDQALKRFEKGPQRRLDKAMRNIRKQIKKSGLWKKGMSDVYENKGIPVTLTPSAQDILERYMMAKDNLERIEFGTEPRMHELAVRLRQQMNIDAEGEMEDADVLSAYVEQFESQFKESEIAGLWKAINECTDFGLDWLLKGGVIGKDYYERLKQRRHYIPERGFAQLQTNEELRDEIDNRKRGNRNGGKPMATQAAHGGESMATDVIAYMLMLNANSVQVSQENTVKRAMFNLMQENLDACQQMGYPVPQQVWYIRDGVDEDGNPRYKASMEQPSEEMQAQNDAVKERIRDLQEDLRMFGKDNAEMKAHIQSLIDETKKELLIVQKRDAGAASVDVAMLAGEEVPKVVVSVPTEDGDVAQYIMQFPARHEIANALNGITGTKWEDKLQKMIGSNISALYTVYNPTFFATNLPRDIEWIIAKGSAERGMLYPAFFAAQMARPATTILPILEYVSGVDVDGRTGGSTLSDAFTTDGTIEHEFYQFLNGGGNTGYTQMNNIQKFRKKVERMTEGPRPVKATMRFLFAEVAPAINEFSELWTRFAVYRATKAMLHSENATIRRNKPMSEEQIEAEALHDAKNFSTNFNRKGAGGFINFFNSLSMFSNAAIQGVSGAIRTFENPKKAIRGAASIMILPAFIGWMCTMLSPDDDDEGFVIPSFMRENNLIFMDKRVPLSQELIPWYRIGVNYALMQQGRRTKEQAIENIGMGFAEHGMPVPPVIGSALSTGIDWIMDDDDDYSDKETRLVSAMTQLMYAQYLGNLHQLEQNKNWAGSNLRNEFAQGRPQYLFGQNESELFQDLAKLQYRLAGGDMNVPQNTKSGSLKKMNEFEDINPKEIRAYLSTIVPSGWVDIATYAYSGIFGDEEPRGKDKPIVNKFLINTDRDVFEYSVTKELKAMIKAYDEKMKSLENIYKGYTGEQLSAADRRLGEVLEATYGMSYEECRRYIEEEISKNGNDAALEAYLTFGVNLAEKDWNNKVNANWRALTDAYTKLSIYSKGIKQGKSEREFIRGIEAETGIKLDEHTSLNEARKILTAMMLSEIMRVKGIEHTIPDVQKWMLDQPWLPATERARKSVKK